MSGSTYKNNYKNKNPLFAWQEIKFIFTFSLIFLGTVVLLSAFGLIPSEFQSETGAPSIIDVAKNAAIEPVRGMAGITDSNTNSSSAGSQSGSQIQPGSNGATADHYDLPVRITIPSVAVDGVVKNPTSTNVDILDDSLKLGAVRYPGSGVPGLGNMFIFGHSTGFSIVQNQAYKVFNNIKKAKEGSEVFVYAGKNIYIYKVTSVKEVNKDNTLVTFDSKGPARLTLSTCDSFGSKSDRFVVEAVFDRVVPNK